MVERSHCLYIHINNIRLTFGNSRKILKTIVVIIMTHEKLLKLTKEQEAFLEECELEFSNRYTSSDPEYQSVFERNLPPPPIIENWASRRGNFNNHNRSRNFRGRHNRDDEGSYGGHSRNEKRYDRPYYNNDRNNQNYSNKRQRSYY